MSFILSIHKTVPKILREFSKVIQQRKSFLSYSTHDDDKTAANFPADRKWFDQANKIISNQFGSALELVNSDSGSPNGIVHQIISCELLNAVAIMQERIGSSKNKTILNIERKCQTGIGLNNFFQATSILLMSCLDLEQLRTAETTTTIKDDDQTQLEQSNKTIRGQQLTLAKLTEMMYFSTELHNQISELTSASQHLANKILITLGDYIMAQILFRLSNLKQPSLTRLLVTILQYKSEAIFMDLSEITSKSHNWTIKNWIEKNEKNYGLLFAVNFYSVLQLAKFDDNFVKNMAFEFGKNLGLAIRAFQDMNRLVDSEIKSDHQTNQMLFNDLKIVLRVFCANAQANLEHLPLNDDAKKCFQQLLNKCNDVYA